MRFKRPTAARALEVLLERARRDPQLAEALRVAPVQTIRTLADLGEIDRQLLADYAQAHDIHVPNDEPLTAHGPLPRAYVRTPNWTRSIKAGTPLDVCAAFEFADTPEPYEVVNVAANWRVGPVIDFKPRAITETGGPITQFTSPVFAKISNHGVIPIPTVRRSPFNREEVGYGWKPVVTLDTKGWEPGLYAVQFAPAPIFGEPDWDLSTLRSRIDRSLVGIDYFIVRPPAPRPNAKILLCWPFATTAVYAGDSLVPAGPYKGTRTASAATYANIYDWAQAGRTRRISLDRPFDNFAFADERVPCVLYPLWMWNYIVSLLGPDSVDPCTSLDLHHEPLVSQTLIKTHSYQLLLSVGHDEYWSKEMRDNFDEFILNGGNAAFFSGNTGWGEIRLDDGGKTITCYKAGVEDPISETDSARVTTAWAANPMNRPENSLHGVSSRRGCNGLRSFSYTENTTVLTESYYRDRQLTVVPDPTLASDALAMKLLGGLQQGDTIPSIPPQVPLQFGANLDIIVGSLNAVDAENDGAEFWIKQGNKFIAPAVRNKNEPFEQGSYLATGLDGTPLNFRIMAIADWRWAAMPGWATLGYYTNVGVVFAAGVWEWAHFLQFPNAVESAIKKVTIGVLSTLSNVIPNQPKWTFAKRRFPPLSGTEAQLEESVYQINAPIVRYPWEVVLDSMRILGIIPEGISAIAAGSQGHLFAVTPSGKLLRRDVENPDFVAPGNVLDGWISTGLTVASPASASSTVRAMACSTHGSKLKCSAEPAQQGGMGVVVQPPQPSTLSALKQPSDNLEFQLATAVQVFDLYYSVPSLPGFIGKDLGFRGSPGNVVGLGEGTGRDSDLEFMAIAETSGRWLYGSHVENSILQTTKIGRWQYAALAGGGFEGKLYAASASGALMCREGGGTDEEPRGLVDLVWRKIGSVPIGTYALAATMGRIYALAGSPAKPTLLWRALLADPPYKNAAVAFMRETQISTLQYKGLTLELMLAEIADSGNVKLHSVPLVDALHTNEFELKTAHVTRVSVSLDYRAGADVFFCSGQGAGWLYRISRENGALSARAIAKWPKQTFWSSNGAWTIITSVQNGRVLFYNAKSGECVIGRFNVGPPSFQNPQQPELVPEWTGTLLGPWTHIVAANDAPNGGYVVLYDSATGNNAAIRVRENGSVQWLRLPWWGTLFSIGWDRVVPVGQTFILFYESSGGSVGVLEWLDKPMYPHVKGDATGDFVDPWGEFDYQATTPGMDVVGVANGLLVMYAPPTQQQPYGQATIAGVGAGTPGVSMGSGVVTVRDLLDALHPYPKGVGWNIFPLGDMP